MDEKFIETGDAIDSHFPICNKCMHHMDGLKCIAFEIIPDEILFGANDHSVPLFNQGNTIVFEAKNA